MGYVHINNVSPSFAPNGEGGTVTVSSTAVAITDPIPANTTHVELTALGNDMRYRYDGVDPTASIGKPLAVGESVVLPVDMASAAKWIRQSADGTLLWQPLKGV